MRGDSLWNTTSSECATYIHHTTKQKTGKCHCSVKVGEQSSVKQKFSDLLYVTSVGGPAWSWYVCRYLYPSLLRPVKRASPTYNRTRSFFICICSNAHCTLRPGNRRAQESCHPFSTPIHIIVSTCCILINPTRKNASAHASNPLCIPA